MLKRIFSIFAIALIITGLFFEGYSMKCPVFADDTLDGWMDVTTNEQLVEAFKYYCKSRDLTIEGSVADGITSFTTKAFNGICNTLGIDMTALQAQLKYRVDGNQGLQYLFTTTGVDAYNQIFAQFLQDNELEVGDEDVNKQVDSGETYTDDDGYISYVYYTTTDNYNGNSTNDNIYDNYITKYGSPMRYDQSQLMNLLDNGTTSYVENIANQHININMSKSSSINYSFNVLSVNRNYIYCKDLTINTNYIYENGVGFPIVYKYNGVYYFGTLSTYRWKNKTATNYNYQLIITKLATLNNTNVGSYTVNIVSNLINNNHYEGDTIINNEGDIINNYPDNPDNPDLPSSNPSVPDSGGWQDFQLPSMPNDWLIYGMEKKFPFDIPFNIMFALSLLNHEPEIPQFEGDIDLKVCTWHYDIDLTPFDDIATILRRFEVLAFIIGLALLTKELIMWG